MAEFSYDRALTRISQLTVALGIAGAIGALIAKGPRWSAGFLIGAAISSANFYGWKRLAGAFSDSGKRPVTASAVLLGFRYLLIAGVIYAIVNVLGIALAAILAGLFVSVAAILLEILYELVFLK